MGILKQIKDTIPEYFDFAVCDIKSLMLQQLLTYYILYRVCVCVCVCEHKHLEFDSWHNPIV